MTVETRPRQQRLSIPARPPRPCLRRRALVPAGGVKGSETMAC